VNHPTEIHLAIERKKLAIEEFVEKILEVEEINIAVSIGKWY